MTAYKLLIKWTDGRVETVAEGNNPSEVRAAEARVSRNPRVIDRIELHDLTGPLETLWSRSWV
jgi:hypothetical protein